MKQLLLALLTSLSISTAHAITCANTAAGTAYINHRSGTFVGRNFSARVSCTRNTPRLVYWKGGFLCVGRTFYGRVAGSYSFSCRVRSIGRAR